MLGDDVDLPHDDMTFLKVKKKIQKKLFIIVLNFINGIKTILKGVHVNTLQNHAQ